MTYAWIITTDHLDGEVADLSGYHVAGPSDAPDWMISALSSQQYREQIKHTHPGFEVFTFYMYDDDGILYYTGKMITDEGVTEQACYGPLGDYGMPNAGCTSIRYRGHPEMDCS
jgi:hypothetical protein